MKIQKIKPDQMNPAPYNPRTISDEAYEGLKASIKQFGYVQPIIWNKKTGNIVSGHQRYQILIEQGIKDIECVVVDLDDSDEKALNITQNNQAISGEYTDEVHDLVLELDELDYPICELVLEPLLLSNNFDDSIPETNQTIDEEKLAEINHKCPSCQYEW